VRTLCSLILCSLAAALLALANLPSWLIATVAVSAAADDDED
jgi:hypothetical protein